MDNSISYIPTDIKNSKDRIVLEGKHEFDVNLTLGLVKSSDFALDIEFQLNSISDVELLNSLFKLQKALSFKSPLLSKEGYDIIFIVVVKFEVLNTGTQVIWNCLSDSDISLIID